MKHFLVVTPHPLNPERGYQIKVRAKAITPGDYYIKSGSCQELFEIFYDAEKLYRCIRIKACTSCNSSAFLWPLVDILKHQLERKKREIPSETEGEDLKESMSEQTLQEADGTTIWHPHGDSRSKPDLN